MDIIWSDRKRTLFGLPLSFTKYELEEERLFVKTGFLNQNEDEVRLYRIMDLSLSRSIWQRMFGVGTIHCASADKSLGNFDIVSIKKPRDVKEMLSKCVEEQRDKKRVSNREYMSEHDYDEHDYDDDDL